MNMVLLSPQSPPQRHYPDTNRDYHAQNTTPHLMESEGVTTEVGKQWQATPGNLCSNLLDSHNIIESPGRFVMFSARRLQGSCLSCDVFNKLCSGHAVLTGLLLVSTFLRCTVKKTPVSLRDPSTIQMHDVN